jgi:hypothetical protein
MSQAVSELGDKMPTVIRPLSKLLRETEVERSAWSKLRSKHADTGTVANFMDTVEDIDHVKSHRSGFGLAVPFDFMGDAGVDLREERKLAGVGKTAS